jgi:hypothetical protein
MSEDEKSGGYVGKGPGMRVWFCALAAFVVLAVLLVKRMATLITAESIDGSDRSWLVSASLLLMFLTTVCMFVIGWIREAYQGSAKVTPGVSGVEKFVHLLVPATSREYLMGDLEEQYRTEIACRYGRFRSRCWWWKEVLGVVWPYVRERVRRALGLELFRKFLR